MKDLKGRGTLIVQKNVLAHHPQISVRTQLRKGQILPVLHCFTQGDNVHFTLEDDTIQGYNTWIAPIHALNLAVAKPEDNGVILTPKREGSVVRPATWTVGNIAQYLREPIIEHGNFTWYEATHGGTRMPRDLETVKAMIRIATVAQKARDFLKRPLEVTSWYRPDPWNTLAGGAANSRHKIGDAIDAKVTGCSGASLYRMFDPWWPGGLGCYGGSRDNIIHIDARINATEQIVKCRWYPS